MNDNAGVIDNLTGGGGNLPVGNENDPNADRNTTVAKFEEHSTFSTPYVSKCGTLGRIDYTFKLVFREQIHQHLDTVQGDLESLKEFLRNEDYTLDANAVLGVSPFRIKL